MLNRAGFPGGRFQGVSATVSDSASICGTIPEVEIGLAHDQRAAGLVRRLQASGKSLRDIAKEVGVSSADVHLMLRATSVVRPVLTSGRQLKDDSA